MTSVQEVSLEGEPIEPASPKENVLYSGEGGNLARVAIYRGIDELGRVIFEGYKNSEGILQLTRETSDPREDVRDVFKPTEEVTVAPQISGGNLLDWLVRQDLTIAQDRLKALKCIPKAKRDPYYKYDKREAKTLVKYLTKLQAY